MDNRLKVYYFILRDDTFPLQTWLMNPFSHRTLDINNRVYNYQINHRRRVVENAFGILARRYLCVITACVILHNSLWMRFGCGQFQPENIGLKLDGVLWRNNIHIRTKTLIKLARHSEVCWLITSEMKGLCLSS